MTATTTLPGPRDGLDTGSLSELASTSAGIVLDVRPSRERHFAHRDLDVPEAAGELVPADLVYA